MVVAKLITAALRVYQEQRAAGQQVEHLFGVVVSGDRVAHIGAQPLQDRRVQKEVPYLGFEVIDDLLGEVVGDQLVAAREAVDERVHVGESLERDRRELQARRPPVGPSNQRVALGSGQRTARDRFDQVTAFIGVEGQVVRSDLDQPGQESERLDAHQRVPSGAQDEPHVVRKPVDELLQVGPHGLVDQPVHVVEH